MRMRIPDLKNIVPEDRLTYTDPEKGKKVEALVLAVVDGKCQIELQQNIDDPKDPNAMFLSGSVITVEKSTLSLL